MLEQRRRRQHYLAHNLHLPIVGSVRGGLASGHTAPLNILGHGRAGRPAHDQRYLIRVDNAEKVFLRGLNQQYLP